MIDCSEPTDQKFIQVPSFCPFWLLGKKHKDLSTCGGLHSIGSDVTRTRGRSDANTDMSVRTQQEKREKGGNTPISKAVVCFQNMLGILVFYITLMPRRLGK